MLFLPTARYLGASLLYHLALAGLFIAVLPDRTEPERVPLREPCGPDVVWGPAAHTQRADGPPVVGRGRASGAPEGAGRRETGGGDTGAGAESADESDPSESRGVEPRRGPSGEIAVSVTYPHVDVRGPFADAIARVVAEHHRAGLKRCYRRAFRDSRRPSGRIRVEFRVTRRSRVRDVEIRGSTFGRETLTICARNKIRGWVFPEAKGGGVNEVRLHIFLSSDR